MDILHFDLSFHHPLASDSLTKCVFSPSFYHFTPSSFLSSLFCVFLHLILLPLLSARLSVCLSVCRCLTFYLNFCLAICICLFVSFRLSVGVLYFSLSINLYVCMVYVCVCVCMYVCMSVCLYVACVTVGRLQSPIGIFRSLPFVQLPHRFLLLDLQSYFEAALLLVCKARSPNTLRTPRYCQPS